MRSTTAYALARLAFGAAVLAAPAQSGRLLSGEGGTTPDAQAFLRGMGGREVGLGLGMLAAERGGASVKPWLLAGVLFDSGDVAGIAGAWGGLPADKRGPGVALAGAAAVAGLVLLARS
jgi:hypothetical protein